MYPALSELMQLPRTASFAFAMLVLVACSSSKTAVDQSKDGILYEGNCDKAACADLDRPETDCTTTAPRFTCSDKGGACAITYECPSPDDPGAAVSFAPCADQECGAKPTTGAEAGCASGQKFTGASCGKLNGASTCKWHPGCATLGEPIAVDPAKLGPACSGSNPPCPSDKPHCVVLPLETGIEGAHCVADPCGIVGCPASQCAILESYPEQIACDR